MRVIGILGGIASGKSQVTRILAELGCGVLDADRAGHEVLRQDAVKQAIRERWGNGVFDSQGEIDRYAVAQIVFAKTNSTIPKPNDTKRHLIPGQQSTDATAERRFLEQLTHGRIGDLLNEQSEAFAAAGQAKAIVLDAALLLEAGWDNLCDTLVFVNSPRESRLQRAIARGWTEAEFDAREAAQESLQAKRQRADFEIDNSADLQHLRDQVIRFWGEFLAAYPA
jgi:dephospho-CoA kinase